MTQIRTCTHIKTLKSIREGYIYKKKTIPIRYCYDLYPEIWEQTRQQIMNSHLNDEANIPTEDMAGGQQK